jgi:hypothetical protein
VQVKWQIAKRKWQNRRVSLICAMWMPVIGSRFRAAVIPAKLVLSEGGGAGIHCEKCGNEY